MSVAVAISNLIERKMKRIRSKVKRQSQMDYSPDLVALEALKELREEMQQLNLWKVE